MRLINVSATAFTVLVACTMAPPPAAIRAHVTSSSVTTLDATTTAVPTSAAPSTSASTTTRPPEPGTVRPDWLGTRILPERPDGLGEIQPTPLEMINRRFPTIDHLRPPTTAEFVGTVGPIPPDVLARSTWREECPVSIDELSYLVVSFVGFDGLIHTGELIVNARHGEPMLEVFRTIYEQRFPLEQMRVITFPELDAPPTGDWNDTTSFVCRPVVASDSGWSMHAYGLAIDLNPFHNPYLKGDVVVPELASAYTDRSQLRPGMLHPDDPASQAIIEAFANMGWEWGGNWQSLKDWMHFSENGR